MQMPLDREPTEADVFDAIVRDARKEHLQLTLRTVRGGHAGFSVVIVSGARYAAGYRSGTSWPQRFRAQLADGRFG
jgi:hypothetical protein